MTHKRTNRAILYGAGGIGVVLAEVLVDSGWGIDRVFDDAPGPGSQLHGVPVEPVPEPGPDDPEPASGVFNFVSIGKAEPRERIVRSLEGAVFGTAVHPTASVSPTAIIGEGSMVFHGSVVQARAKIGRHVIVNTAASIDHDCVIGDFSHIAPQVALCGLVSVGARTEVGAGASVIPSVRIGDDCRIGAGAVVIRDVPDGSTVVGNPGRIV